MPNSWASAEQLVERIDLFGEDVDEAVEADPLVATKVQALLGRIAVSS